MENKLSLKIKIIYSFGNLGIGTITVLHILYLVYFFFPPQNSGIPYLIPQGSFFLGITVLGLIMAFSRLIDAFLDPIIAMFSDRLNHKKGKRIPIMRIAALPLVICYTLIFFVPVSNEISNYNVAWLLSLMLLSAFFLTAYMIPFYTLMVELAHSSHDKIDLGTISSAFWFIGFLFVSFTPSLWSFITESFNLTVLSGIRASFVLVACVGLICLLIPAFFIDEKKYASANIKTTQKKLIPTLKKVLKNRSFRFYLFANTVYQLSTYVFESGLIYFITVLAIMDAGLQGPLTTVIGVLTLACYPLINKLSKTKGKKFVLRVSLLLFALTFVVVSLFGVSYIPIYVLLAMVVILSPFAQAAFGILPQVITSDCAAYDQYKTGENSAGMYIAANGFFVKIGSGLGMIMFTSFLLFGKDVGNDIGIRLATLVAAGLSIIGLLLMSYYDEKEILTYSKNNS